MFAYTGGFDTPPEVEWSKAWAAAIVGLAYDRFGSGVKPTGWDAVFCACGCGGPRGVPCWNCEPEEAA